MMLCTIFLSIAALLQAQKLSIGPNAGYGSTWISKMNNRKYKSGGNVGLSLIYSTKSSFGLGADVKYSFEGGEREYQTTIPGSTLTTEEETSLNYIRVPLKAMWFFGKYGNRVRPKVALGPSFGFLVGGKIKTNTTSQTGAMVSHSETNSKDYWDTFDFGLTGSAGLNYRLVSKVWLNADVAYYHGLTNAINEEKISARPAPSNKNRNIVLNVGVNLGL